MNAQNIDKKPVVKRESKNKIRVEFDRTPLKERLKARFFNFYFLSRVVLWIFRLVLMVGISYIVLFPFLTKVAGSVMSPEDFVDVTVRLIPKNFTLDIYKAVLFELDYWEAFFNTLIISLLCGLLQTFVCCLIGYGLAKFRFKGNSLIMMLVILTMIVPHQTLELSLFMKFRYFDLFGILSFFSGGASVGIEAIDNILGMIKILPWPNGINMCNTYAPLLVLSATGLAFKNGLYVFMLRQFFRGIPDSLEESAYIDGASNFRTFIQIVLPMSVPMLITVFLFSFCWQWTDNFYTELFFTTTKTVLMPDIIDIPKSLKTDYAGQSLYYAAIRNTCGLCIIAPLVILYLFGQRYLVEGIERSGLTAE